jgi:hypothetical protein
MREFACIALLAGFVISGPAIAQTGTGETTPAEDPPADAGVPDDPASRDEAKKRLTDLLFSDRIERIDFQATTYEEGTAMINLTADEILDAGIPLFGNAARVADRATEIIEALNSSHAKGLYATFQENKQTLFVRSRADARYLAEIVGTTMSIIFTHYRTTQHPYREKAGNLFGRTRRDEQDSTTLLELYRDTVRHVASLPLSQQAKYLN